MKYLVVVLSIFTFFSCSNLHETNIRTRMPASLNEVCHDLLKDIMANNQLPISLDLFFKVYPEQEEFIRNHESGYRFFKMTSFDKGPLITSKETFSQMESRLTDAIIKYKNKSYRSINKAYRRKGFWRTVSLALCRYCRPLKEALEKLDNHEGIVYRGINFKNSSIAKYADYLQEGNVITEQSFLSTSRDFATAENMYAEADDSTEVIRFVIISRTGKSIENSSNHFSKDKEVLFAPHSKFKVEMVNELAPRGNYGGTDGFHGGYTVYLSEIVD